MKISEFLDRLDPWEIYRAGPLEQEFRDKTGQEPCWPTHTHQQTARAIHHRGVGGILNAPENRSELLAYGHEIAESLARKHVPGYQRTKIGRGSAFREAVKAIQQHECEQGQNARATEQ